ncbi:TetR/AcrR family transcriptional regulator [Amycolatopsis sp., V23-08]|uniref:TetR/AcrR family transcriptional regulator n=1 Tax=Amycolatopsis heterodermiae TaxID=3110235 RepID=A0ABU5R547_9PSEU|nr:TetR/AcrR family transcriptional regulator [Amycolatopsis sp., V23-08]MEA5360804.1 TetR/AcrR family transcriptional regulator [Amycolatopsis sp., V23-08]
MAKERRRGGGRHPASAAMELTTNLGPETVPGEFWGEHTSPVARALLSSAVQCFARKGFHATTTRDITAVVGLSPGSLYVHFASKEAVLFHIARTGHERALAALTAEHDDGEPRRHLRRLVAGHVSWHARHHTVARVCQYELAALEPDHLGEVLDLRQQFSALVQAAVERGVHEGVFDVPDVDRTVRAILSLGIDLVRWYRLDGADSPDTLGESYAELAARMVGSSSKG